MAAGKAHSLIFLNGYKMAFWWKEWLQKRKNTLKIQDTSNFAIGYKGKNGSPYLYILIFAKYSTEYLAYYVYVHICISNQVSMRFFHRAFLR